MAEPLLQEAVKTRGEASDRGRRPDRRGPHRPRACGRPAGEPERRRVPLRAGGQDPAAKPPGTRPGSWRSTSSTRQPRCSTWEGGRRGESSCGGVPDRAATLWRRKRGPRGIPVDLRGRRGAGYALGTSRSDLRRPTASGCRMPPLAVPHLSYLLRGLGAPERARVCGPRPGRFCSRPAKYARPATPPRRWSLYPSPSAGDVCAGWRLRRASGRPCCSGVIVGRYHGLPQPGRLGEHLAHLPARLWQPAGERLRAAGRRRRLLSLTDCCSGASVNGSTAA